MGKQRSPSGSRCRVGRRNGSGQTDEGNGLPHGRRKGQTPRGREQDAPGLRGVDDLAVHLGLFLVVVLARYVLSATIDTEWDADEIEWRARELLDRVRTGELEVRIHGVLGLEDAPTAHRLLEGRETSGKVLLRP